MTTAAETLLFVCTGNTCRSPLAEAIARQAIAERLGVAESDVAEKGWRVASAGVGAGPGSPASENSVLAGREIGLDLSTHRSQPVTASLLDSATHVYCLSDSHADAILYYHPDSANKVEMLDPTGAGIPDPFGGDLATYQAARDRIAEAVRARIDALFA